MGNKKQSKDAVDENSIFVYLGPTIRGVIQHGSIFRGSEKDKAIENAADQEHVRRLMIRDVDLAAAKEKLKNGGNSLSVAYHALLSAK